MIVVTGAYGFIGSCLVTALNDAGFREIIVVDDFYKERKEPNLEGKWIREWIHRDIFIPWFEKANRSIDFVFHMGARTSSLQSDKEVYPRLNLGYSKRLWNICSERGIPMVYASSFETYGDGSAGTLEDTGKLSDLKPLNARAGSKHEFDQWVLAQKTSPPRWAGLKLRDVYGPNEYHKGVEASLIHRIFGAGNQKTPLLLAKPHGVKGKPQKHPLEFTYFKDVLNVLVYFMGTGWSNGLYNVGSGEMSDTEEVVDLVKKFAGREAQIEWVAGNGQTLAHSLIKTPTDCTKLIESGYDIEFTSLADGIQELIDTWLMSRKYY